jgi:hypothetical protein
MRRVDCSGVGLGLQTKAARDALYHGPGVSLDCKLMAATMSPVQGRSLYSLAKREVGA